MPFNYQGDLYKCEVVGQLNEKGHNVKNVHALNLILEEMGLQERYGNHWLTTKEGAQYTIFRGPVFDADAWHPSIVDAVSKYLQRK